MSKYWMIFLGTYLLGAATVFAIDWAYAYARQRRRDKDVARRLALLQEFAKGLRVA